MQAACLHGHISSANQVSDAKKRTCEVFLALRASTMLCSSNASRMPAHPKVKHMSFLTSEKREHQLGCSSELPVRFQENQTLQQRLQPLSRMATLLVNMLGLFASK
jgi:hypothetical protein